MQSSPTQSITSQSLEPSPLGSILHLPRVLPFIAIQSSSLQAGVFPFSALQSRSFLFTPSCSRGFGAARLSSPVVTPLFGVRFLRSEILNTEFGYLYMPSTGALMLLTALHTCDQVRDSRATFFQCPNTLWVSMNEG